VRAEGGVPPVADPTTILTTAVADPALFQAVTVKFVAAAVAVGAPEMIPEAASSTSPEGSAGDTE
jgi:hypothetical protein